MNLIQIINFIIEKLSPKFQIHKLKKIIDYEFAIVEKIIVKLTKLLTFYLDFYKEIIENEIKLANISKNDKILHVGSGSIPATSILLVKKTNANLTGIDNNINSVNKSKKLISNVGLSDKIEIFHVDAQNFSFEKYDVIIFSQGLKPIYNILKKVAGKIKSDKRLIYRTTSQKNQELNKKDLFIKDFFNVKEIVRQEKNGLLISVLLEKK